MLWLEMSRDFTHGGGSWGFTRSVWSPTRKQNSDGTLGTRWAHWENLLKVCAGDFVLHLRDDETRHGAFVGYSVAETDGYETAERPPEPGVWGYSPTFYRVPLTAFTPFPSPIELNAVFAAQDAAFRAYFEQNDRKQASERRSLFFVIQAGRLQRLNGGYLSEVDEALAELLLGPSVPKAGVPAPLPFIGINTGERIQELRTRMGQREFADRVRANYGHRCCFPDCGVADGNFLIGSHIARWADVPALRGRLDNGLCFCLMHDKAFELGLFTVDGELRILVNRDAIRARTSRWGQTELIRCNGQPIRQGAIMPSREALQHHWNRVCIPVVSERTI